MKNEGEPRFVRKGENMIRKTLQINYTANVLKFLLSQDEALGK